MAGILADRVPERFHQLMSELQPSVDIPPGTSNNILKQAGLK
jgi:hypothetical protein